MSGDDVSGSAVLMPLLNGCAKFCNCDEIRELLLIHYFGYSVGGLNVRLRRREVLCSLLDIYFVILEKQKLGFGNFHYTT